MMTQHSYIKLSVNSALDKKIAEQWFAVVKEMLPSLTTSTEIRVDGNIKSSGFYMLKQQNQMCYIVPLTRDPTVAEVQKIAIAWNKTYLEGDFEIDYSTAGTAHARNKEVKQFGLREIALEAARLNHGEWMRGMSEQGWSYGQRFDQKTKRHPVLRPWDELGSKYQLQELKRFESLMEVLSRLSVTLSRKT